MKHLQKFLQKSSNVHSNQFLSEFALGSFVTLQLYQKQEIKLQIIILALSLKHPIE